MSAVASPSAPETSRSIASQFLKTGLPLLFCSVILGAEARADTSHRFYAGVGFGGSSVDDSVHTDSTWTMPAAGVVGMPIDGYAFDDDDLTWSAFVGYRPLQRLALEAGFRDLGKFRSGGTVNPWTPPDLAVEEWFLDVRLTMPVYKRLALTA